MTIKEAKEVLKIEAEGILNLQNKIGSAFEKAVSIILEIKAKGRLIITGMGKSGLVGRKISATLSSTGTPSLFLHPAEAIHGDLGMVTKEDVILAISNSGYTSEINMILPMIKNLGTKVIGFTGNLNSPMAGLCDIVIDVGVKREACPMGIVPTASTTATMAMGDALAVVLINSRHFNRDDFKKYHPGGSLGERLSINISEIMLSNSQIPIVRIGSKVPVVLDEMNLKNIGATLVVDHDGILKGIVSDGDLRRALINYGNINEMTVEEIMSPSPKTIDEGKTAAEALGIMELYGITHLAIVDKHLRIKGIIHLHDLLGRQEFRINGGV